MSEGLTNTPAATPAGGSRRGTRVAIAAVVLLALSGIAYEVTGDDNGRHQLGDLSCPTASLANSAVDFQTIPTWATPTQALAWLQAFVPGVQPDGWELEEPTNEQVRWLRRTNGHIVSIATFRRAGDGWTYDSLTSCGEEG